MIAAVVLYRIICVIVDLFLIGLAASAVIYVTREAVRAVRNRIVLRRCPLPRRNLPAPPVDGDYLSDDEAIDWGCLIAAYGCKPAPEPTYRSTP